ncbi:MAG: ABC transporter ATP-binding protein [Holophagales bacterium]|nr:ABC transporter ATP-binding protein [Holophagales bacterium]
MSIGYGIPEARFSARGPSGGQPIARDLDLDLCPGQLVCFLGPNGAGKSTLMRTLAGLQPPLGGRVEVLDEDGESRQLHELRPRQLARRLALVLTDRQVPATLTGMELVRLGRHPHTPWTGRLGAADHRAVQGALDRVGASALARRPLGELSDGERQKLSVARALAQESEILILDEVTAFLDLPRRLEIVRLLRRLAHEEHKAVLLSTHDLDLALRSADLLWLLDSDGRLRTGLPEELVLDGAFGEVFATEGVDFEPATGAFHPRRQRRGRVWVEGEGLGATWTRHAFERLGYEVLCGEGLPTDTVQTLAVDLPRITVREEPARVFLLHLGGEMRRVHGLAELVDAVVHG